MSGGIIENFLITDNELKELKELLYAFFWVIPRHLHFICRHFGTHCLFLLRRQVGVYTHLPAYEDGTDTVF